MAFLTACGVGPRLVQRWADAYERVWAYPGAAPRTLADWRAALAVASHTPEHTAGLGAVRVADLYKGLNPTAGRRGREAVLELLAQPRRDDATLLAEHLLSRRPRAA
ncbi:hypothetical protein GCM10009731_52970 [Streptomyces globosus]